MPEHLKLRRGEKVKFNIQLDHPAQYALKPLTVGEIYTIRGFNVRGPDNPDLIGTGCGFYLAEVVNRKWPCLGSPGRMLEISYDQSGFESADE